MSRQENLLDRLRTHIYLNDIHPVEWFEDFDKLRSGRVTKDRFRRCFEFLKFKLTDEEFAYLCDTEAMSTTTRSATRSRGYWSSKERANQR